MGKYILEGKQPVKVPEGNEGLMVWALWIETADRQVVKTRIAKEVIVSTVFLGLDYSFGGGEPELFETMVFGGSNDRYCERYHTWEEAEQGHKRVVKMVRTGKHIES